MPTPASLRLALAYVGIGRPAVARGREAERAEARFADLDCHRALVDAHRAPLEPGRDGQGRGAPGVRIEHQITRVRAREDEPLEQRFGLLRRVPGPFLRDRRDDADVPDVAERRPGRRLLGRARPRAATVASHDRSLPARSPRRSGRSREGLEELDEAGLVRGVLHVPEEDVVHALKVRRLARPAAVAPHDFAGVSVLAEDLVAENLHVVARARIDVDDGAPLRRQKLAKRHEPIAEAREVARQVRPSGRRTRATGRAAPFPPRRARASAFRAPAP